MLAKPIILYNIQGAPGIAVVAEGKQDGIAIHNLIEIPILLYFYILRVQINTVRIAQWRAPFKYGDNRASLCRLLLSG